MEAQLLFWACHRRPRSFQRPLFC